ncbi:MAG: hypothetical protein ONA69_05070 [candidate division KSB1 bacterium]|nr:hypothetical protein [candidate division KSB1 bacterium]MDZ7346149.1 hypothetical protein [candidate division KSB1 bacterium]
MTRNHCTLIVPQPYNWEASLKSHGWFQLPPFYWREEEKTLYWATAPEGRPVLLCVKAADEKIKGLEITGDFSDAAPVLGRMRRILNLDLELTEFYELCRQHSFLAEVPVRGLGRIMRCETVYEDLFKGICGMNVQWNQAVRMIRAIAAIGDPVEGGSYRLFPTPRQILDAGESFLKQVGRVGYRSRYLIDLAVRFSDVDLEEMTKQVEAMDGADCRRYFESFAGIGHVTARYLAALYGHFDEPAVDSLVINFLARHRFGGRTPTAKEVVQLYAPFGKWSYLAYWMEFILNDGWIPREP